MNEDNATNLPDNDQLGDGGAGVAGPNELDNQNVDELGDDGQPQGQADDQDDDSEEVEHEGQKYRIPKELKGALMMQADYTRKTQELADMRRSVEQEQAGFRQANAEQVQALATVVSIDQQLQQFAQVNWQQLSDQDPVQAQKLWMQFSQLKDIRQQLVGKVQQMEQQRAFDAQQEAVKRIEEGRSILMRDIPNWGPEVAKQLNEFATKEFGFQPQELSGVVDPRIVKVLHAAMIGTQMVRKTQGQISKQPAASSAKPVPKVGGTNAPSRQNMNAMPIDAWMNARNEQIRKSKGR